MGVLVFEIVFVADDDSLDFIVGVVFDFEEPFVEALEAVTFGEVEDEEGGDGALVVGASDGLEGLLSGLGK